LIATGCDAYLDLEGLAGAVGEGLVLHEDHVSDLETGDEVLDRGAEVASAGPHVLDERDLLGRDLQLLGQPAEVELDALVGPELLVVGLVENLDTEHDEAGVVAARDADVVEVVEAYAELRADQRVRGGLELARDNVGLEAVDAGLHEVDVIAPARHDGVALDGRARDARGGQRALERLVRLTVSDLARERARAEATTGADEAVLLVALRVAAGDAGLVVAPEVGCALRARGAVEAQLAKGLGGVELVRVSRKLGLSKLLELLSGVQRSRWGAQEG